MPNIRGYTERFLRIRRKIDGLPAFMASYLNQHQDTILQLNKDGILLGRDTDGKEFTPGYLADPYFQTPEQKLAYWKRKQALRPRNRARIMFPLNYVEKRPDTPDLRVTKKTWAPGENFQDSMYVRVGSTETTIGSTYPDTPAIVAKYKNKVFGLTPLALDYFKFDYPNSRQALIDYFSN